MVFFSQSVTITVFGPSFFEIVQNVVLIGLFQELSHIFLCQFSTICVVYRTNKSEAMQLTRMTVYSGRLSAVGEQLGLLSFPYVLIMSADTQKQLFLLFTFLFGLVSWTFHDFL